jgi:thioredoxin reductase (NADPH)
MSLYNQANDLGVAFDYGAVSEVKKEGDRFLVHTDVNTYSAKALIIATSIENKKLGVPGEEKYNGKGVSYCATCDGAFFRNQSVTVIGGGDMALEEALALTAFAAEVHLIHRRDAFAATKILVDRVLADPKIVVHWNALPIGLEANDSGRVAGVKVQSAESAATSVIPSTGVFVAAGVLPNTELLEGTGLPLDERGYIKLLDGARSLTALPGVFAAGDCADPEYRQAIVAAGMGARAGLDAVKYLSNH